MSRQRNAANVRAQYATPDNLQTRINIHAKYSVNPQSFADWIFEQYELQPGDSILELGCGTGYMWRESITHLPVGCRLTLTDLSAGMVEQARATLAGAPGVRFECADIQDLPYADGSMDVVIANMMLYHVPDIARALSEVRRVLRSGGRFYCATYGENGMGRFVEQTLDGLNVQMVEPDGFTLQNGGAQLEACFDNVRRVDYEDELRVTDAHDLLNHMRSMQNMICEREITDVEILTRLEARRLGGVITVPKEYGMFCARRA